MAQPDKGPRWPADVCVCWATNPEVVCTAPVHLDLWQLQLASWLLKASSKPQDAPRTQNTP